MSTGKQNAVHAQQNSDGTFELHLDSTDSSVEVESFTPPPEPSETPKSRRMIFVLGGVVVLLGLGAAVMFALSKGEIQGDFDANLEPVQGFRPYMGGASSPPVSSRPSRARPVVEEVVEEEIIEEESQEIEVMEGEEIREEMAPPEVLNENPPIQFEEIDESEVAPEEDGWDVEEESADPLDEQGSLPFNKLKHRGQIEAMKRNSDVLMRSNVGRVRGLPELSPKLRSSALMKAGRLGPSRAAEFEDSESEESYE